MDRKSVLAAAHEGIDRNTWCEQLYRYVEHYRWEPQHVMSKGEHHEEVTAGFYKKIRSQEVPLNFLTNLYLRVAPSSVRWSVLRLLHPRLPEPPESVDLLYGEDQPFTQPDVLLETPTRRFLIELKVGASPSLSQVRKYMHLHALLDVANPLSPYLGFIAPRPIETQWGSEERGLVKQHGVQGAFRSYIEGDVEPPKKVVKFFGGFDAPEYAQHSSSMMDVVRKADIGAITWQDFGDVVFDSVRSRNDGELGEMMRSLSGDFLADLARRGLWNSPSK